MRSSPEIVAEARSWVGTPFLHQARLKGVGVDCVGVILGVGRALDLITAEADAQFGPRFAGYSRAPNPRKMRQGVEFYLDPLPIDHRDEGPDGAVGWFEWREELPMHLAIMATFEGRRTMIHSYESAGRCVENGCDATWRGRVNSWWTFRGAQL